MSRCSVNRWGPGTTCEKPINTEATKELKAKLDALQKERAKQDSIWTQASEPNQESASSETKLAKR